MNIWEVLQDELERYRSSALAVRHCTNAYEARCMVLIHEISIKSFDEAQEYIDELYDIQNKLATVKYKYEFKLSEKLDVFVYAFERNDNVSRKYWYDNFKAGLEWPHEE